MIYRMGKLLHRQESSRSMKKIKSELSGHGIGSRQIRLLDLTCKQFIIIIIIKIIYYNHVIIIYILWLSTKTRMRREVRMSLNLSA